MIGAAAARADGRSTVHSCVMCPYFSIYVVERLIAAGADVNKARTVSGATPLCIAAANGCPIPPPPPGGLAACLPSP